MNPKTYYIILSLNYKKFQDFNSHSLLSYSISFIHMSKPSVPVRAVRIKIDGREPTIGHAFIVPGISKKIAERIKLTTKIIQDHAIMNP